MNVVRFIADMHGHLHEGLVLLENGEVDRRCICVSC